MIFFQLPKNNNIDLFKNIEYKFDNVYSFPAISYSLSYYLNNIKEQINDIEGEWDIYKKYTNPFEYIHTTIPSFINMNHNDYNIQSVSGFPPRIINCYGGERRTNEYAGKNVSQYKPLSRSFFKMIEILKMFYIFDGITSETSYAISSNIPLPPLGIKTFHLAEGPGGFIEAVVKLRNNPNDIYIGMTITDNKNPNVPSWKKSTKFLKNNKNVFIETGFDKTGDLLNIQNFKHCVKKYGSTMHFITADGGFDFSSDFNSQETTIVKLLFAQVAFAVCMQKRGGSFVLKIFDSFHLHTIDILYLLSSFYERVYICKPQTSRVANSEKYIVCLGFLFDSNVEFYPYFYYCFESMNNYFNYYTTRILNVPVSNFFLVKLEEYNAIFGQQQIENIFNTIQLIKTKSKNKQEKIKSIVKHNIQKSVVWCNRYL